MKRGTRLAAWLFAWATACGDSPAPEVAVDPTSQREPPAGSVVGFTGAYGSHAWRGIPYAEPPVGEWRWRASRVAGFWDGTRHFLESGDPCPQPASPLGGIDSEPDGTPVGAEDCLTLDVYAPRFEADQVPAGTLPVMVWIHGGGNVVGAARLYDGGRLAAEHGVVVVTIQYRLGPLGFFRHAALRRGATPEERSGNFAILDQIRALEWVRDNATAFGGDPRRVTIFGESAGGRDVVALLVSKRARGLFDRAIVQSGGVGALPPARGENFQDESPRGDANSSNEVLARLWVDDGRADDRESARAALAATPPGEIAAFLRGLDATTLRDAYRSDDIEGLPDVPQLFRDGVVLPETPPAQLLARGEMNRVPVMFGTNRDEFRVFLIGREEYASWWFGTIVRLHDEERFLLAAEYLSDMWKATGADDPADAIARAGAAPVWVYRFDWDEEPDFWIMDASVLTGAAHGFEMPFVFGHWRLGRFTPLLFRDGNLAGREELAGAMMSYWAEFAHRGDPGRGRAGDAPEWLPWRPGPGARMLVLDTSAGGGIRLESAPVTAKSVLARVGEDPRLRTTRDRCAIYYELARWGRGFGLGEYQERCAEFPYADWPWEDAAD